MYLLVETATGKANYSQICVHWVQILSYVQLRSDPTSSFATRILMTDSESAISIMN